MSLIITVMISCFLGGCFFDNIYKKIDFFSKSVLNESYVPNLPKIHYQKAERKYSRFYRYKTTEEDFNAYVSAVYEYLCSLDFKYFGYRGNEIGDFFGAAPKYEFCNGTELSDFKYTEQKAGTSCSRFFVWNPYLKTLAPAFLSATIHLAAAVAKLILAEFPLKKVLKILYGRFGDIA